MKKYMIYFGILVLGILLGWLLFGGSSKDKTDHHHGVVTDTDPMWTCSMHPQIMQPEPGDCPICGMDLIPAESDHDGLLADQFKLTENAMALANIRTTLVGKGDQGDNVIELSGKIGENEEANAVQVSYFSGRIQRLEVGFTGEEVRKGQLLATIYSPELYAAQQELLTAATLKESQPGLYQAVRNKLKLWKLSEKQIDRIEETGKVKEYFPVHATVSGTVTEKLVAQGDYIKQGQPLLKIADLNTVWANFDSYENQIDRFKMGQEVKITSNAYPNKEFKGIVDFIDPVINNKTRTITLRVVLNNKEGVLKPGMFVVANVEGTSRGDNEILTLPASAVLWTGKRSVVYLKTNPDQPVFEMREVVLGNRTGDGYEILQGLSAGDEIVTNGTFTVDAAAQLQGKKSMMDKDVGTTMTSHEKPMGMDHSLPKKESDHTHRNERLKVPEKFQEQLKTVYYDYIDMKDALVKENSNRTSASALNLLNNLSRIDKELLSDNTAHARWMSLEKELRSSTTAISKSSDIKAQRDHFKHLSSQLITAVQLFGVNTKVYVEFCPMADTNKGAYWLSKEEKVINPYFGKAMLTCGEVKQVLE